MPLWTVDDVTGVDLAAHSLRTYLEQSDVRRYLTQVQEEAALTDVCDLGAGYGRMSPVLGEAAPRVVAYEREPGFVEQGRSLLPSIEFVGVDRLDNLPTDDSTFDLVLGFTVLQHLTDADVLTTAREVVRVLRQPGYVLLCEETDPTHRWSGEGRFTIGRAVEAYTVAFAPLRLVATSRRRVEPIHPRSDVGQYMLFRT